MAAMASSDAAKEKLGEGDRERHVMLMHPQSAVVYGLRHFYPYGERPVVLFEYTSDTNFSSF